MRKNFNKSIKLYDVAGGDINRPAMQCILFQNGYAYATEAHMMIKARLEDITNFAPEEIAILEGKMISADSLKRIYSHQTVEVTNDGIIAKDTETGCKITYTYADPETVGKFPNCEKVLADAMESPLHAKDVIGINYGMLDTLTNAMGCKDNAKLEIRNNGNTIVVTSLDLFSTITGLLMLKQTDEEKVEALEKAREEAEEQ